MTDEERAQVVHLLRCAADDDAGGSGNPTGIVDASDELEVFGTRIYRLAWAASDDTPQPDDYRSRLLEAAQRVEEGSWP